MPVPGGSLPAEMSGSPGSSSAWGCCQMSAPVLLDPGFPAALPLRQAPEHTCAFVGASHLARIFCFSSTFISPCPRNGSGTEVLCSSRCAGSWMLLRAPGLVLTARLLQQPPPWHHGQETRVSGGELGLCEHPALVTWARRASGLAQSCSVLLGWRGREGVQWEGSGLKTRAAANCLQRLSA